jgi:hypothetical protein
MKLFKRKLNTKGFSHVEAFIIIVVVAALAGIGFYVYHKNVSHAGSTYTKLATIVVNKDLFFGEEACIASQSGTGSNQTDVVTAFMNVDTYAGKNVKSGYDPEAYYRISGGPRVKFNNWVYAGYSKVIGNYSTIIFNLQPASASAIFWLGVQAIPNKPLIGFPGSKQTIGSLTLCNPAVIPPPTVSLSASPSTVSSGSASKLIWSTTYATSCTASGSWSGNKSISGSVSTGNLTTTSTYTLSCSGSGGSSKGSTTVTVGSAPTVSINASPSTVNSGGSSTLSWSTTNATSCTASGAWSGGKATSGTQSTGALKVSSTYTLTCSDASGVTTESVTVSVATVGPGVACAGNPATTGSTLNGANYPLIHTTVFKGSSFPTNLQSYGTGSASPYGYYEQSHLVMTGNYLAIKGYPDSSSGYGGDVTAGFDLSNQVPSSGGFDVCMTLSTGSWQNGKYQVNMVGNSWPADNSWGEGENDFFEGSPASAGINIHGIGCGNSCGTAVYHAEWPSVSISDGQPHLYSARWDPVHGYTFFLDGTSFNYQGNLVQSNYTTPTTPHHLSLQMQDSCNCNSVPVEADIYWAAAYGYN